MFTYNPYKKGEFPSHLPNLNNLYTDLFSNGKGFRAQLVKRVSKHLKISKENCDFLCQIIEFVHNSSLLHDDLIDRSPLRRGKEAAWLKYSPEYAVLAGDYLLARVMLMLSRHGNLKLVELTSSTILDLLEGEWLQDAAVKNWDILPQDLDQIHRLKTASLKVWCLQAPFYCIENYDKETHKCLRKLGHLMGMLFQRADDLLDFDIRNYEKKATMGDLNHGYLNSFGVQIYKQLNHQQKEQFIQLKSMEELQAMSIDSLIARCLVDFDNENLILLREYQSTLLQLSDLIDPSSRSLIKELTDLASLLYWRKK